MDIEVHKKLIEKYYRRYKLIIYVECPAFDNEKIYFNKYGFRHLIRKGKKLRKVDEQIERLELLKYAPKIISSSMGFKDFNKNKVNNNDVDFWSFQEKIDGQRITVIIRQMKNGPKHFFSIMAKKAQNPN